MKRNIAIGIFLIGALALSSCSTTKLANTERSDDVYFSNAKAGTDPIYAAVDNQNPNISQEQAYSDDDDDYFYYDDYASRINRFNYYSPFSYYDNLYYGYGNYAFNNGFSLGFNYGPYGYGYSPYGYGGWGLGYGYGGWGYGGWGLGLGYGLGYGWGGLWGYGGFYGGGWGGYYAGGTPRPNRGIGYSSGGSNVPRSPGFGSRVSPANSGIGYIPGGRGVNNTFARPARTDARPTRPGASQATRTQEPRPVMQQPTIDRTSTPSNNSGGGSRSSSGGSSGGGGRPGRP
ncbi:MAG: hypothetical protein AAGC65_06675 [Mucilaginibacter sp.]|uniref:hypothetical protein n=1 Tax=Mucilaginibacter sp. TaxID=1882438 RepID=UPI0031A39DE4